MNRKKIAILALLALFASSFIIASTKAQVVFAYYPNTPDTSQPSIIINSPTLNATYNSTDIALNFTVTKPENWSYTFTESVNMEGQSQPLYLVFGRISDVYYSVDDGANNSIAVNDSDSYVSTNRPDNSFNFNINLNLTKGQHSIRVGVEAVTYNVKNGIPPQGYLVNAISNPIFFTIMPDQQGQSKQESPIAAFAIQIIIALVVVIVIICSLGLLYYRRHRKPLT